MKTKISLGELRTLVHSLIESMPPGRWDGNPGSPQDPSDADRLNRLGEVDTDPTNNPGRPADASEYIGMKPKGSSAMARPDDAKAYIGMSNAGEGGGTGVESTDGSDVAPLPEEV